MRPYCLNPATPQKSKCGSKHTPQYKNSKKTRKTHKSVIQIVPMSTAGMKLQEPEIVIGSGVATQALHPIAWVAEPGSDSLRPPRPWLCSESPETTQDKKRNLIRGLLFPRSGFPVPVHSEEAYPRPKPCLASEGKQVRANGLTTHYEPILTATSRVP